MIDETRYREVTATAESRPRIDVSTSAADASIVEYPDVFSMRTEWGAIWAGVLVAFGVQMLLTLLGAAIGVTVVGARGDATLPEGLGIGAGIWWVLTGIISLFLGGWTVAFSMGPRPVRIGALHGFVMWCTVTAISALLVTSATSSIVGVGMNMLGSATTSQQQGNDEGLINRIRQSGTPDSSIDDPTNDVDSPREQQRVKQAEKASAGATWWTFFALVLGATAAVIGGCMTPDR